MTAVDFWIGNDRHHVAMVRPVVERLAPTVRCRVFSVCELRGVATPTAGWPSGVPVEKLLPRPLPRRGGGVEGTPRSTRRRLLRALFWQLRLAPTLRALARSRPRLAALPNDVAFPYDRVIATLARREVPYLLLQEGVRFPLPGTDSSDAYGTRGALAVAAWGPVSRDYFTGQGVDADRVRLTGSPRFDDLTAPSVPSDTGTRPRRLLLVTNPIDQQGFCSQAAKLQLVGGLVERLAPRLESGSLELELRIHGGEDRSAYAASLATVAAGERVRFAEEGPLHSLLAAADAVAVMASTVGLEALLVGRPLGVLEIPGHGYAHDYVERGAAVALPAVGELDSAIDCLISDATPPRAVRGYLDAHLSHRGEAAARVADLVRELLL